MARLEALARSADPGEVAELRQALRSQQAEVRQVAATLLGRAKDVGSIPYLSELAQDTSTQVRQSAVWALATIGGPQASSGLQVFLDDPSPEVRRSVIWALGRLKDKQALAHIQHVQADPDELVRETAGFVASAMEAESKLDSSRERRRRPAPRWLQLALAGTFLLSLAACLVLLAQVWSAPLGPTLATPEANAIAQVQAVAPTSGISTPVCGTQVMRLLLIGLDSDDAGYNRGFADVIRVARIDFAKPSVILLAIPRDLWVTIPGLEQHQISEERLKTAYPYGNVYGVSGGGASLLAQTLALNLGLNVDRYAAIDFASFAAAIDQIGGVDISLPKDVGNPQTDPPYFPAGLHHLDGKTALAYARVRPENSSDLARIDRQTQVILAARQKLLSPELLPRLPGLIDQMRKRVLTDLSPSEISALICVGRNTDAASARVFKIESPLVLSVTDSFGYERLLPDPDRLRAYVSAFQSGDLAALGQSTAH